MTIEDNELVGCLQLNTQSSRLLTFPECDFEQRFDINLFHKASKCEYEYIYIQIQCN